jgi:hypothetical protein
MDAYATAEQREKIAAALIAGGIAARTGPRSTEIEYPIKDGRIVTVSVWVPDLKVEA